MDLAARQTRDLFLAGRVAFPTPFLTTGTISVATSQWIFARGAGSKGRQVVMVQEYHHPKMIVRIMLQKDVSAIFIPGAKDAAGVFQISQEHCVRDLEQGEWFVEEDVNEGEIRRRLNKPRDDISTRDSILRGIVFIAEDRPILRITEVPQTAGADEELLACCTRDYVKGCCTY